METSEVRFQNFHVVLLHDPVTINKIPIDPIRAATPFNLVSLLPDDVAGGALLLASESLRVKNTLQSNRLEYIDENDTPFLHRSIEALGALLNALPFSLSIRSFGINLFMRVTPREEPAAGRFIAENYIKDFTRLEEKLGQRLFSASVRLFLGSQDHHRDFRLTPVAMDSKELILQYHLHREIHIAENEKLIRTLADAHVASCKELDEWREKLP